MIQDRPGIVPRAKRKLIYTGIDCPEVDPKGADPKREMDLIRNLARLKTLPFDGIAPQIARHDLSVPYPKNLLGCNLFSGERHNWDTYRGTVAQLKRLKDIGMVGNFFTIAPNYWFETSRTNKFDWFDDNRWRITEDNLRLYARLARESGVVRGFALDVEAYRGSWKQGEPAEDAIDLFSLNLQFNMVNNTGGQPDPKGRYQNRIRERGRAFYAALNSQLPGAPILLYLGYGLAGDMANPNRADLYPFFLDGILQEMDSRSSKGYLIDGYEGSYRLRTVDEHRNARNIIWQDAKRFTTVPNLCDKYLRVGLAKWLDAGEGAGGRWNEKDAAGNYFRPDAWGKAVNAALDATDEYVWVWSNGSGRILPMTFGRPANVPATYIDATRKVRKP